MWGNISAAGDPGWGSQEGGEARAVCTEAGRGHKSEWATEVAGGGLGRELRSRGWG